MFFGVALEFFHKQLLLPGVLGVLSPSNDEAIGFQLTARAKQNPKKMPAKTNKTCGLAGVACISWSVWQA